MSTPGRPTSSEGAGGRIIEEGGVAEIFERSQQDYTRELLKAAASADLLAELDEVSAA